MHFNRILIYSFFLGFGLALLAPSLSYGQYIEEKPTNAPWKEKHRNLRDMANRKQGTWKFFNDDGDLFKEIDFVNNKMEGMYKSYYPNGQAREEAEYLDSRRDGEYRKYFYSGEVSVEGKYLKGKKDSKWTKYFMDGSTRSTGDYKLGRQDGFWKYFDRKGNVTKTITFKMGQILDINGIANKPPAPPAKKNSKNPIYKLPPGGAPAKPIVSPTDVSPSATSNF